MDAERSLDEVVADSYVDDVFGRASLCIGRAEAASVVQLGDHDFCAKVQSEFARAESSALEQTFCLKQRLRATASGDPDFWRLLVEGMADIAGSQYAFVAKRVLFDDENSAVEMPEFGEQGSCLMGLAFYFNDRKGGAGLYRDYKYQVYGCPCQWMRHDKVLLIPNGLTSLTPENPNAVVMPILAEAYLAVPLFHEGKCFAHMGVMWTADGLKERPVSWGMLEMFLHALEDQVTARVLEGDGIRPDVESEVIPHEAVTSRQSLRPYARSLSHELRTPMQGVVGMLDVMNASILEATEFGAGDAKNLRVVVEALKENIKVAQDSSQRAVDVADNMVHAYHFDMKVPSSSTMTLRLGHDPVEESDAATTPMQEDDGYEPCTPRLYPRRSSKRRRESGSPEDRLPYKMRHRSEGLDRNGDDNPSSPKGRSRSLSPPSFAASPARLPAPDDMQRRSCPNQTGGLSVASPLPSGPSSLLLDAASVLNSRPTKIRKLLSHAVHETLRSGGRPDSTRQVKTPLGEKITVQTTGPGEGTNTVEIELRVDDSVPDMLIVDSNALVKILSVVFNNAVKFTREGRISVTATIMRPACRFVLFTITDTGEGIPKDFLPHIFDAFTREDESLTRQRDGLGLGLLVAKGISHVMGGNLWCEQTSTDGPNKGSEFRIMLPLTPGDARSMPGTPAANPNSPSATPPVSLLPGPLSNRVLDAIQARKSPFAGPSPLHDDRLPSPSPPRVASPPPPTDPPPPPAPQPPTSPLPSDLHPPRVIPTTATTPTIKQPLPYDCNLASKLPLRILVVEDNKINRTILVGMLFKFGYTNVLDARDGEKAVQTMSADTASPPINVILMDLWMPLMDGYEATERILAMPRYAPGPDGRKKVTILAVSADATAEAMEKSRNVGMEGFMSKPYRMVDLERLLLEYCTGVGG